MILTTSPLHQRLPNPPDFFFAYPEPSKNSSWKCLGRYSSPNRRAFQPFSRFNIHYFSNKINGVFRGLAILIRLKVCRSNCSGSLPREKNQVLIQVKDGDLFL